MSFKCNYDGFLSVERLEGCKVEMLFLVWRQELNPDFFFN